MVAGEDELGQGEEGQGRDGGHEPAGEAVPGLSHLGRERQCGGCDKDSHRVGDRPVLALAAPDLQSGGGGGEFGDDGVSPAEPAAGSGGDVAHGPVVDVGEGRGSGHDADEQQNDDLDEIFGAARAGCAHPGSPPQRCWAAWRETPSRRPMSAQE